MSQQVFVVNNRFAPRQILGLFPIRRNEHYVPKHRRTMQVFAQDVEAAQNSRSGCRHSKQRPRHLTHLVFIRGQHESLARQNQRNDHQRTATESEDTEAGNHKQFD